MDEDRLSPQLGRLIDEAKAAARSLDAPGTDVEGVALLTEEGTVHSGAGTRLDDAAHARGPVADLAPSSSCAAELALEGVRENGDHEIVAASVAAPHDPSETVLPGEKSYRCLAALDAELPLVLKQHGRWVVLPLSKIRPDP
jgi:hypothetical protein